MKKFDISTSKLLLIILGVLVAMVIGFSSKAVGAEGYFQFEHSSMLENIESTSISLLQKTSIEISHSLHGLFVD